LYYWIFFLSFFLFFFLGGGGVGGGGLLILPARKLMFGPTKSIALQAAKSHILVNKFFSHDFETQCLQEFKVGGN